MVTLDLSKELSNSINNYFLQLLETIENKNFDGLKNHYKEIRNDIVFSTELTELEKIEIIETINRTETTILISMV